MQGYVDFSSWAEMIQAFEEQVTVLVCSGRNGELSVLFPKQFTVRGSQFFLKMCPPFVSLMVSAHFHWPCSISIHLSPRSVTGGVRPFSLAMQHFYSFVSQQVCHCWCPPFSGGHAAFLFICLRGLSLVVSALFRCFYSFASHVCHC